MPNSKLTLSVDRDVTKRAKKLARQNRTSVSAMFSHMLMAVTGGQPSASGLGPITRKATGLINLPARVKDHQLVEDALAEEHGSYS